MSLICQLVFRESILLAFFTPHKLSTTPALNYSTVPCGLWRLAFPHLIHLNHRYCTITSMIPYLLISWHVRITVRPQVPDGTIPFNRTMITLIKYIRSQWHFSFRKSSLDIALPPIICKVDWLPNISKLVYGFAPTISLIDLLLKYPQN